MSTSAHAEESEGGPACSTPRKAVASVFQPEVHQRTKCLESGTFSSIELVDRIGALFTGKLRLKPATISDSPDFKDSRGRQRLVVHPKFPEIAVEKIGKKWVWTEDALDAVERRYVQSTAPAIERYAPKWTQVSLGSHKLYQLLALLLAFIVGIVARQALRALAENRIRPLIERTGQAWASKMVFVVASPGATLVMAAVLRFVYPRLGLPAATAAWLGLLVRVLIILSVVWAAYRFVDVVSGRMEHKAAATDTKLDDQLVPLVRRSLKVLIAMSGLLVILQNIGVNVGALVATLGVGGIAIALAAKDTVANIFGSVMIFVDRPFQIGDWVNVGGVEGVVEEVGFRSTRIRTFYDSVVTVPNAKFIEANIDNYGRRSYRRCKFTLNLTYDATPEQMQAFVEGIRAIIQANSATRKDAYEVHMSGFGAASLDVFVYFFFKVDSWSEELKQRHNVLLEIMRLAHDLGVEFAFPTQTLHLASVAKASEVQRPEPRDDVDDLSNVVMAFASDGARARPDGPKITSGFLPGTDRAGGDG